MTLYRDFETREALDAEYDVDAITPDFSRIVDTLLAKSAAARAALPHTESLPYGPTLDETLDVFPARDDGRRAPVLVFFHGGYWRMLTAKEFNFVALGLARAGITTVIPTHSLCPKVGIDEITRQARAAVAFTARNLDRIAAPNVPVYVGGHSAGAHLSLMCALADWRGDYGMAKCPIAGLVSVSGLFDLRPLPFTSVGPSLQLSTDQILRNSPFLLELPARAPKLFMSFGSAETAEFRRQSQDMFARWTKQGLAGELFVQPDRDHFTAITDLMDESAPLTRSIARFVGASESVRPVAQRMAHR